MARNRRRSTRLPAKWVGRYRDESRLNDGWHACIVLDVSTGGAGLEIFLPGPELNADLRVQLEVASQDGTGVELRGRVCNAVTLGTSMRVGIEWHEPDALQHDELNRLISRQSAVPA